MQPFKLAHAHLAKPTKFGQQVRPWTVTCQQAPEQSTDFCINSHLTLTQSDASPADSIHGQLGRQTGCQAVGWEYFGALGPIWVEYFGALGPIWGICLSFGAHMDPIGALLALFALREPCLVEYHFSNAFSHLDSKQQVTRKLQSQPGNHVTD